MSRPPRKRRVPGTLKTLLEEQHNEEEALARLEQLYDETKNAKVLKAIRHLDPSWQARGRPEGVGIDDSKRLARMAKLLDEKKATTVRAAAVAVATEEEGHSFEATVHRLQRKFRAQARELRKVALTKTTEQQRPASGDHLESYEKPQLTAAPPEEEEAAAGPACSPSEPSVRPSNGSEINESKSFARPRRRGSRSSYPT